MTVTINGTSGVTTPGVNSTGSNVLGDNVADTLNVGNGAIVTDSSGNVGIGTASPGTKLDIQPGTVTTIGARASTAISIENGNGAVGNISQIGFGYTNSGATTNVPSAIGFITTSTASSTYGDLYFATRNVGTDTAPTERMRIDSSGNLLVGTTSVLNFASGSSSGFAASPTGQIVASLNSDTNYLRRTGTDGNLCVFYKANSAVGSISVTASATSYNTSSDYRLKENIQPMQNALAVVQQLNPVTYTWKADGSDGQGFIAHELQAVVPDCVTGEKDAVDAEGNPVYQGIDTSFLVATLCKAIQELTARVEQLEAK